MTDINEIKKALDICSKNKAKDAATLLDSSEAKILLEHLNGMEEYMKGMEERMKKLLRTNEQLEFQLRQKLIH